MLLQFYTQSKDSMDIVSNINRLYEQKGFKTKSNKFIVDELLEQNIIDRTQCEDLLRNNEDTLKTGDDDEGNVSDVKRRRFSDGKVVDDDVKTLKEFLVRERSGKMIAWVQKVLAETCYVKLAMTNQGVANKNGHVMDPVSYYYTRKIYFSLL